MYRKEATLIRDEMQAATLYIDSDNTTPNGKKKVGTGRSQA